MNLFVGLTDYAWYETLRKISNLAEVNFWRPSGSNFRALQPGELFLFKLHAPHHYIVGGAFFVKFFKSPISVAWSLFGIANGATSLHEMRKQVQKYDRAAAHNDFHKIGCILLSEPFFFLPDLWLPIPSDFARHGIVQGKKYSLEESTGRSLYEMVAARLQATTTEGLPAQNAVVDGARFGQPHLVLPRLGQGGFRVLVSEAYDRRCAITGERTLPVLEAAHIRPYSDGGPHALENGLLLRSDLHRLFDLGYVTIEPDTKRLIVSRFIREEFHNGRHYYELAGKPLNLPLPTYPSPRREFLQYHANHVYLGS